MQRVLLFRPHFSETKQRRRRRETHHILSTVPAADHNVLITGMIAMNVWLLQRISFPPYLIAMQSGAVVMHTVAPMLS